MFFFFIENFSGIYHTLFDKVNNLGFNWIVFENIKYQRNKINTPHGKTISSNIITISCYFSYIIPISRGLLAIFPNYMDNTGCYE